MNKFDWYAPMPESKTFLQPKESKMSKLKAVLITVAVLSLPLLASLYQEYVK